MKTKTQNHVPRQWGQSHSIDAAVLRKEWEIADREALRKIVRKQKEAIKDLLACCRWLEAYAPTPADAAKVRAAIAKAEENHDR